MINEKYYMDIKQFPSQFKKGLELAKNLKVKGEFNRIIVCGMGGSSLYVDIINNFFAEDSQIKIRIEVNQGYNIPKSSDQKTLFVVASYSGNTEETLYCLDEIEAKGYKYIVLAAGGQLMERAEKSKSVLFKIPQGLQPRLSTGYFFSGLIKILSNSNIIPEQDEILINCAEKIDASLDETRAKDLAEKLKNKVPVVYATDNNWSIARVTKIKFNENTKTQAFWNFFPELNHNEMVGFSNLVMNPLFMIFQSQYTNQRNNKRIEIFSDIMRSKSVPVEVINMSGSNVIEEIMNAYYFADHVTYYLAEAYGIDPEPVDLVEEFKKLLK
jgi:glucose/mannose-6-phosphate isomerase